MYLYLSAIAQLIKRTNTFTLIYITKHLTARHNDIILTNAIQWSKSINMWLRLRHASDIGLCPG